MRGVQKRYPQSATQALGGVDFDIAPGTFLVMLGPSGSGKTTLLRGLAGIERFDAGEVRFGRTVVSDPRRHVPAEDRGLAMVFQDYALWPHLTVRQNVAYALKRLHLDRRESETRVLEVLDRIGMAGKEGAYPQELSGGQQQRVALARAIVGDPALLLFDEPLSNLDADLREHLRVEISTLTRASGATAVYITHDQSEAFALADVIGVLRAGRLEQLGPPEEIYRDPATPFVARFTGLAGSFHGVVERVAANLVWVRLGEQSLLARATVDLLPGQEVELMVRPTAATLVDAAGGISTGPRSGESEPIAARVADVAFRGRGYDHLVATPFGNLVGIFDRRGRSRGSTCNIVINPEGCLAFPLDAERESNSR